MEYQGHFFIGPGALEGICVQKRHLQQTQRRNLFLVKLVEFKQWAEKNALLQKSNFWVLVKIEDPLNTSDLIMAEAPAGPPEVPKDTIDDVLMLSELREEGKAELLEILSEIRGRKCLVIDVQLGGLLSQIIVEGSRFLKDNGVQYFRELKGELADFVSDSVRDNPENIIYLVRPNLSIMKLIAQQINEAVAKSMYHYCYFHCLIILV